MNKTKFKKALAVDLGATNLRIAFVSSEGKILTIKKIKTPDIVKSERDFVEKVSEIISDFISENNANDIKEMGMSIAGALNKKEKTTGFTNFPLKKISLSPFENKLKVKINLLNDCEAAVLAEKAFGKNHNTKNLVYITISSGIGGGVISEDRLLEGVDDSAAEIGHFTVNGKYNLPCGCGGVNHWEAYASGVAIPKFFKAWAQDLNLSVDLGKYGSAEKIFDAAKSGDKTALDFVDELGKINGQGISSVIFAYNPEVIVLGGAVVLNNPRIIKDGILKNVDKYIRTPKIKITKLGDEITLLGAAYSVFEK